MQSGLYIYCVLTTKIHEGEKGILPPALAMNADAKHTVHPELSSRNTILMVLA